MSLYHKSWNLSGFIYNLISETSDPQKRFFLLTPLTSMSDMFACFGQFHLYLQNFLRPICRPIVKESVPKIFLISHPKHMLWVLKRIVSVRWFFLAPKTYVKTDG